MIIDRLINVDYGKLSYYRSISKDHKFDILFLHGLGMGYEWFPKQFETYDFQNYSWIVPAFMGYGKSSRPNNSEAYTMHQYAKDVVKIVEIENVKKLIIMAHSMGGPVSVSLLEQLISKNAGIHVLGILYLEGNLDSNDAFYSSLVADMSFTEYQSKFDKEIQNIINAIPRDVDAGFYHDIGPFTFWALSKDLAAVSKSGMLLPKLKTAMEKFNFQTYFVFGEQNKGVFTSERLVQDQKLEIRYVPNTGHLMHEENPTEFWSCIHEWIRPFQDEIFR
ncbi:MAG: alpha/beta fold hydrolase [Candidatus Kariarchaeaceae archaeon]|jgi:pimeloyl-ACP methyl ester carboxylesterase